jgi:hypothetical protein
VHQGSIDWVALSKSTVSFSVELLARYSRAGVEALTVAVAQALCAQFNLPVDGQKRLELAVSKLKAYSSTAKALWFGVGFKHPIRSLMETEQGATFVALSSSLTVSYHFEYSAAVLKALCDKSSLPENLTPSLSQWAAFVKLCAPAVIASQFPILVEGFSRLLMSNADQESQSRVLGTSTSELAAAILEVAQLSTRKVAHIRLIGNADCGWLAALAEWLFCLRVEIVDPTGNALYQSKGTSDKNTSSFDLTIIRLEDGQSSVRQSMLHGRTTLVLPGKLPFGIRRDDSYNRFYWGRSEWSNILKDTFGSLFQRLLEPEIIAFFLQVLYSGLQADRNRITPSGDAVFTTDRAQLQHSFLHMLRFAASRLPELAEVEKYGEDHISELDELDLDRVKLQSEFGEEFYASKRGYSTALVGACSCCNCQVEDDVTPREGIPVPAVQCLSKIAIAIYEYISILSFLDIDDTIRPSSKGLIRFSFHEHIMGNPFHITSAGWTCQRQLASVLNLLTGWYPVMSQSTSAVASYGVCVYRPSLEDPSIGVEAQLRIRVVPGQIERNDKIYHQLNDGFFDESPKTIAPISWLTDMIEMLGARPRLQVTVEETLDAYSLNTNLVVFPETDTAVRWGFVIEWPGDRDPKSIGKSCSFGALSYFFTRLWNSLSRNQCLNVHANPAWYTNEFAQPWSGRCSMRDLPWWTDDPTAKRKELPILQSNEWAVVFYDADSHSLNISLCSVPLLYCILIKAARMEIPTFLFKPDDCLVCMFIEQFRTIRSQLDTIFIHFIKDGQIQKIELSIRAHVIRSV